jgi:hypothetical protein
VERAARRGKKGWHVGQHEHFRPLASHAVHHGDGDGQCRPWRPSYAPTRWPGTRRRRRYRGSRATTSATAGPRPVPQ